MQNSDLSLSIVLLLFWKWSCLSILTFIIVHCATSDEFIGVKLLIFPQRIAGMTDFCLCIVLFVYICLPIIYTVQAEMCRSMELILLNRTKK